MKPDQLRTTFNPWWGDLAVAEAEAERLARQEDKREAEAFQAKIDARMEKSRLRYARP